MANTSKGIYYPYNYNEIADVPEDMKQMAESINKILEGKETEIATLQNKVESLHQENIELANNMPHNTVQGESLHIEDSAKYSRNRLSLSGDLRQETTKGLQLYNCRDWHFKMSDIAIDEDDYISITADNSSGTNNLYKEFHTKLNSLIKISTEYTFIIEIKKVNGNGFLRINSTSSGKIISQFPASATYNFNNLSAGQIIKYKATSLSNFSEFNIFLRSNAYFEAGQTGSITLRISVLDGNKTQENFEYEPFTGGKAKPNTEYPSMPQVVTGVQKISQFGENLFDLNDKKSVDSLFTIDADNWISVTYNNTGSSVKYVNYKTHASSKIKANTNYALFLEVKSVSRNRFYLYSF